MPETASNSKASSWIGRVGPPLITLLSCFVFGLALSRILFEGLFPVASWIGHPVAALFIGLLGATGGLLMLRLLVAKLSGPSEIPNQNSKSEELSRPMAIWSAAIAFLPFSINLAFLFEPSVNLTASRFLFFSSLWLFIVFTGYLVAKRTTWRWLSFILLLAYLSPIYLATLGQHVGTADTFEFQVVAPQLGIVHPTGYPLYLLATKLFTLLPLNSVAWRVNLATAVFGLAAVTGLFALGWRLTGWSLSALLAAALLGLTPTFWSQAIQAEVYTLHALLIIVALFLMREIGGWRLEPKIHSSEKKSENNMLATEDRSLRKQSRFDPYTLTILLALVLGLGLTNHLTTVIMLPPALLTIWLAYRAGSYRSLSPRGFKAVLLIIAAFLLPLLLYAYLPIRWSSVNGEPMGLARFLDWVIGGRFQGALQLDAWLRDGTRYDIVGRLFTTEWRFFWTMLLIFVGAINLLLWQWRYGLILLLTWLGFLFYTLNYYVPDLAVFLLPAQIIFALWWLAGIVAALALIYPKASGRKTMLVEVIFLLAGIIPILVTTADLTLQQVSLTSDKNRTRWAEAVLALPLENQAIILADSDKFPPLYYLQQAEGFRPDLNIMVLPDEASYRAELEAGLERGQPVYLARFLPGLEGIYHLNSAGPLIEVSEEPVTSLPNSATPSSITFDPIRLVGYELQPDSAFAINESALTLYWQAAEPLEEIQHIYLRWKGETLTIDTAGQHPANNTYPTVAWEPGEIVTDYHNLPKPSTGGTVTLEVAMAPPFTRAEDLPWRTLLTLPSPMTTDFRHFTPQRIQVGTLFIDGASSPDRARPQSQLALRLSGTSPDNSSILLTLLPNFDDPAKENQFDPHLVIANSIPLPTSATDGENQSRLWSAQTLAPSEPGNYDLLVGTSEAKARCGWFSRLQEACWIGQLEISGIQLPGDATNFADKIALGAIEIHQLQLQPGGQFPVSLTWQALAPMEEDYTVFVQVLDAKDRIVGQVDSWPLQGTFPTSLWRSGEIVEDPYLIQLDPDLSNGPYKVYIGLYLLETLGRLPVLDDSGVMIDDKAVFKGLYVP